ncbi:ribosomal protein S5 domain 2-type protein [Ganoderma leucocontextum]|nr:ribosomal protein S5 domain 2-type protein [Ganoderma leucocontextum]
MVREQVEVGFGETRRDEREIAPDYDGIQRVSLCFASCYHLLDRPCARRRRQTLQHHLASYMRLSTLYRLMKPGCSRSPLTGNLAARRYSALTSHWDEPLAVSDEVTQQKSTFQAYVTRFRVQADGLANTTSLMKTTVVSELLTHIHGIEPRTRRASHAMYAWRVRPTSRGSASTGAPPNMVLFGSSNGGEAGAGERLERLLELGSCEDVILVVFRWYGGVKLGSDRWRCISSVAKDALDRGGFLSRREGESDQGGGSSSSRKRGR